MRSISQCLNKNLSDICKKSIQIEALNLIIKKYIPDHIQPFCHVGSFTSGCLKLVLFNPNFGTELRYFLPELRDQLRGQEKLYQLSNIKIVIAQPDEPLKKTNGKNKKLSDEVLEGIKQDAEMFENGSLKDALLKLAKNN